MHHFFHLALMAALLVLPAQVRSQSVADSRETLSRVDEFRRTWLVQTDSLDVCSVETADGFADTAADSLSATAGARVDTLTAAWRDHTHVRYGSASAGPWGLHTETTHSQAAT
jgi:hypothetical protein